MWVTRKFGVSVKGVLFHPVCHAVNLFQVDGEQQRGEGTSLSNTERRLQRSCPVPIQQRIFTFVIQIICKMISLDGQDTVRHLATALMAPSLVSRNTIASLFEVNKCSIQP